MFLQYIILDNNNLGVLLASVDAFSKVTSDIYYKHERYQSEKEMEGENQFGSVYSRLCSNWNSIIDIPFFEMGRAVSIKNQNFWHLIHIHII